MSDNEIDLSLLLLNTIKVIKRNIKLIMLFLLLGVVCGLGYYFSKKPQFESGMILTSKILTKENAAVLTESLQELIEDENYELLAEQLNMDDSIVTLVSEIMVSDKDVSNPNPEKPIFLEVTVTVTDNSVLPQLENGIVNFLKSNQYVNQRVSINKQKYSVLVEKTQQEINRIDSLKNKIGANLMIKSITPNVLMVEPVSIYTASVVLFERKQEYIKELELVSDVHLVKGFIAFQKPASPKFMLSLVGGLVLGLVLAVIIVFTVEIGVYLKKLNKEHS